MWACIVRSDMAVGYNWPSSMSLQWRLIMVGVVVMVAGGIVGISRACFTLHSRIVPVPQVNCLIITAWITPS